MNENVIMQEAIKLEEEKRRETKLLLKIEWVLAIFSLVILVGAALVAAYLIAETWAKVTLLIAGFILCFTGLIFSTKIEQVAGYYKCQRCGHKHIPKFGSVLWSMHFGRTRYMKCPKCNKRSWQKKKID